MLQRRRTTISSVLVLASAAVIAACSAGHSSPATTAANPGTVDTTGFAVPTWATSAAFVGPIDGATVLKLQVHLRMQNEAGAIAQLEDISDPDSANYGNFLTDDQFNSMYAPTAADFATVQQHLTSHGLTITESPTNRAYVAVTGTAAQIGAAFGTKIGQFNVNGAVKRAPMSAATLPSNVMPLVKGVLGLAEPMVMKPMIKRVVAPTKTGGGGGGPVTASTCTTYYGEITDSVDPVYPGGPNPLSYIGCGYVPSQIRSSYGLDTAVSQGNGGSGQTVAILDAFESPTLLADAQQYFKNNDPSHPLKSSQFAEYTGPGTPPPPSCETTQDAQGWYGEQSLDVEAVHAVAPGAKIAFIAAVSDSDQDLLSAINMVVTQHLATVISNSWAGVEEGGGDFATFESTAIQAGLKGVGLYFASGDDGDWVQSLTSYGVQGATPSVSFPSSLTQVTAVGGTSLELAKNGGRAFETGWETGNSYVVPAGFTSTWPPSGGGGGGGGGGCSDDAGTGDDDGGAQARTPFFTPLVIKDGGAATQPDDDAGTTAANVWWPAAPGGFSGGAGGGTSSIYLQPKWQKGVVPNALATFDPNLTVPGAPSRVVPDVGMLADPYTGYLVGMTDPVAGTYSEFPIGGTSLATPLFTASIALAQQYAGRHFGSANAVIYKAAKSGGLRDITPPASLQAVALPTYGFLATFSYTGPENILTAAPGFDDETGLGAPNGTKFLEALKQH